MTLDVMSGIADLVIRQNGTAPEIRFHGIAAMRRSVLLADLEIIDGQEYMTVFLHYKFAGTLLKMKICLEIAFSNFQENILSFKNFSSHHQWSRLSFQEPGTIQNIALPLMVNLMVIKVFCYIIFRERNFGACKKFTLTVNRPSRPPPPYVTPLLISHIKLLDFLFQGHQFKITVALQLLYKC